MQIDMKRDRELLGLPPKTKYKLPRLLKIAAGSMIVLLLASSIGQLLGAHTSMNQQLKILENYHEIIQSTSITRITPKLSIIRNKAVTGSSEERLYYALACSYVSNLMPKQNAWLEEALFQLDTAISSGISNPKLKSIAQLQRAGILFDLGKEKEAYQEILKVNPTLSITQLLNSSPEDVNGGSDYYNLYAYILASTTDRTISNPELSLKLIKKVIIQPNGRNASYLDTLASAYFSNNQIPEAVNAQRFALAKSGYSSLWQLTKHYNLFTK